MQDAQSRITVVGARKRVDVALPSDAPIGEYVAALARLCDQDQRGVMPPAWSLARSGGAPLPVGISLTGAGVTDGQVLYLRDSLAAGADPVIEDVDEIVIGEAERQRGEGWPSGIVVVAAGMAWLVASAVFIAVRHGHDVIGGAVSLACAGFLLLTFAWALELRRASVPAPLCTGLSLTSIPCLAVAGGLLGQQLGGHMYFWLGVIAGCNVACLLILAATPETAIFALQVQFAAAAVIAPILVALRATPVQTAAAATIAAVALLAVSKSVAAMIAVTAKRAKRDGIPMSQATTELLIRSRKLLPVIVTGPSIVLAICLPILAWSLHVFPVALALVVSIGLIARARQSVLPAETILVGAAGLVGIFGTVAALAAGSFGTWWLVALLVAVGVVVVGAGVVATATHAPAPAPPPSFDSYGGPPRRRPLDVVAVVSSVISAPLALGAMGILGELTAMGRGIVS